MIRKLSFAAFAVLGCTAVSAAADNRIRTQSYDPDQIVRIIGKAGIQSTIQFADDERIENVAVGDSSAWQITPNRRASLLFVKPLTPRSRTNMTVVTDHRTYMFDLVAGDKWTAPLYALKFSYPNERKADPPKPVQQAVVVPPPPTPMQIAEKLHFDWNKKGAGKLLPTRVFDDGQSLYLAWNRDIPLPAILTQAEDRKEGPVNYRMSGEYVVISPIPANLVLRYGRSAAVLWPSHPILQPRTAPNAGGPTATAAATLTPIAAPPAQAAPQSPTPASSSVKLANLTALYSDKPTDAAHEQ